MVPRIRRFSPAAFDLRNVWSVQRRRQRRCRAGAVSPEVQLADQAGQINRLPDGVAYGIDFAHHGRRIAAKPRRFRSRESDHDCCVGKRTHDHTGYEQRPQIAARRPRADATQPERDKHRRDTTCKRRERDRGVVLRAEGERDYRTHGRSTRNA